MSLKEQIRTILEDPKLTYRQRMHHLAACAESTQDYPPLSAETREALSAGLICDMFEGNAPHRPRYLLPDYKLALKQGSEFLELPPPENLDEALNFLTIFYTQVPSITGYPVFLGDLDQLLTPFAASLSDEELYPKLKLFWRSLDRMLPDAFVHTNMGPTETRVGLMILRLERELKQVVPNISLKVDPDLTSDNLILEAIKTVFITGKPHFINHPMMQEDLGPDYGAVSCYNSLKIGGGAHTLVRLNLKKSVELHSGGLEVYLEKTLPQHVRLNSELIAARTKYLVESTSFFEKDFLVQEGLLSLNRFAAMFGIYGLAEAVNLLMLREGKKGTYGHSKEANQMAYQITQLIAQQIQDIPMTYSEGNQARSFFHSQSGIDSDLDVTAGTRIPIGTEPTLFEHIQAVAPHHRLFNAGISDIFHFEETVKNNPESVLNVIRGAFRSGMRDFTFNLANNDFIRITGYLVRKSDVAQFQEQGARHGSTLFAAGSVKNSRVTERKVKRVGVHERRPSLG